MTPKTRAERERMKRSPTMRRFLHFIDIVLLGLAIYFAPQGWRLTLALVLFACYPGPLPAQHPLDDE